jgi:hypothetical protein
MGGVADEGALLFERSLQALEDTFEGVGERGQLGGGAGGAGRIEVPGVDGDVAGEGSKLTQGSKAAMKEPSDEGAGNEEQEEGAGRVELDGAEDGVPDTVGWCAVEDNDGAELAAVVAGIDEPCALRAKNAIILAVEFEIEKVAVWWPVVVAMGVGWRRGGENEAEACQLEERPRR